MYGHFSKPDVAGWNSFSHSIVSIELQTQTRKLAPTKRPRGRKFYADCSGNSPGIQRDASVAGKERRNGDRGSGYEHFFVERGQDDARAGASQPRFVRFDVCLSFLELLTVRQKDIE